MSCPQRTTPLHLSAFVGNMDTGAQGPACGWFACFWQEAAPFLAPPGSMLWARRRSPDPILTLPSPCECLSSCQLTLQMCDVTAMEILKHYLERRDTGTMRDPRGLCDRTGRTPYQVALLRRHPLLAEVGVPPS